MRSGQDHACTEHLRKKEGILCVAGLKIVALHVSALSMGSWKAPYTLVPEPSAERKNINLKDHSSCNQNFFCSTKGA